MGPLVIQIYQERGCNQLDFWFTVQIFRRHNTFRRHPNNMTALTQALEGSHTDVANILRENGGTV